jgi:SAM-dependent methyltransferase
VNQVGKPKLAFNVEMVLAQLDDFKSLLVCPRCRFPLGEQKDSFQCTSVSCELSAADTFPVLEGLPALIDFDRSIVRREDLRAPDPAREPRWSIDSIPPWLRSVWKPANRVAAANIETLISLVPGASPRVLVVGGGTIGNGVEALYSEADISVVAFDIRNSSMTQFIADAHQIPLADRSVDAVVVHAVLEHVLDPSRVVGEIHRVLRDDGLVYAETPFLQQVHAGPYDFTRYTSSGHRYLFRWFEEIAAGPVAGPGTQLLWSVDHAMRGMLRSELAGKLVRAPLFWLRSIDRLVPTPFGMDNASAYYFLGRRSEHELQPRELVDYYRGAQGKQ